MPCCTVKHEQAAWTAFTELMYSNTTDNCDWLQTAVGDDGDNDVRDVHLSALIASTDIYGTVLRRLLLLCSLGPVGWARSSGKRVSAGC